MNAKPAPNTTPQEQFETDVLPPYREYMTRTGVFWVAKAARDAVAHFVEHVYEYYKHHDPSQLHGAKRAEEYAYYLADNYCSDLALVWEFALAGKHRFLTTPGPGNRPRYLSTATGVVESTGLVADSSLYVSDTGSGTEKENRILMRDGQFFDDVLKKAVDFLKGWVPTLPTYS